MGTNVKLVELFLRQTFPAIQYVIWTLLRASEQEGPVGTRSMSCSGYSSSESPGHLRQAPSTFQQAANGTCRVHTLPLDSVYPYVAGCDALSPGQRNPSGGGVGGGARERSDVALEEVLRPRYFRVSLLISFPSFLLHLFSQHFERITYILDLCSFSYNFSQ